MVLKFNQSHKMLLRKWPWCYGWSASPTLKSTFVEARAVLLKAGANRYLDEVMKVGGTEECWEKQWKEESKRRGSRNHLFPRGSLQSHSQYRNVQAGRIKSSFDSCLTAELLLNFIMKLDAIFTVNTARFQQTRLVVPSQWLDDRARLIPAKRGFRLQLRWG